MDYDPRLITGAATLVVAVLVIAIPLRLWFLHPVNRVFNLGPFVTEDGFRKLLENRAMLFAIGAFLLVNGVSRIAFALRWQDIIGDDLANAIGTLEALMAIWAAWLAVVGIRRIWFRN